MTDPFEAELEALVTRFARELAAEVTAMILGRLGIGRDAGRAVANGAGAYGDPAPGRRASSSPPARGGGRGTTPLPPSRGGPRRVRAASSAPPPRARGAKATPASRPRASSAEKASVLESVVRIVETRGGLSAGEIEREAGVPRPAVAAALRALKEGGRVFMGGTKRFARYATTQAAADQASVEARRGATQ